MFVVMCDLNFTYIVSYIAAFAMPDLDIFVFLRFQQASLLYQGYKISSKMFYNIGPWQDFERLCLDTRA